MEVLEKKVSEIINQTINISDIINKLDMTDNGYNYKKIRNVIEKLNLDISHFTKKKRKNKYEKIKKECPKCDTIFETVSGGNNSRKFCSVKCANSRDWSDEDKLKKSITAKNSKKVMLANSLKRKDEEKIKLGYILINDKLVKPYSDIFIKNCDECEENFIGKKKHIKYCSNSCSSKRKWKSGIYDNINWSKKHKKAYKDGKNFVAGGRTKWYDYKNIRVQGTYELRTCEILDKKKEDGLIYDWEYTNDRYEYLDINDKERTYLLDFKIYETENVFYYLEVKGWEKDNDPLKWKSVRDKGYKLKVWYLEDIKKEESKI